MSTAARRIVARSLRETRCRAPPMTVGSWHQQVHRLRHRRRRRRRRCHNPQTWISGRMGDFYVTLEARAGCEFTKVPRWPQAAAKCNAHLWTRLGSAVAPCFTYGLKTEPSLDGVTLMTNAKFEVIAKLIMCTRVLWRARITRHAHAASHVPSGTAGGHDTPTPVLVRPRGRAPISESSVREHTPHSR